MKHPWCLLNRRGAAALATAVVLCGLSGCVVAPVTGRQRLIMTSATEEAGMGREAWTEILAKETLSTNKARTAAVERVGKIISQAINEPGFEWEFKLFASEEANAFCLPGGKVGVYEGLFEHLANDAELAAVMGHEIAHATARHGGERMTQAMAVGLVGLGLSVALDSAQAENQELWMAAYAGVSTVGIALPYSRQHEFEADEIGALYMAKAGYDPQAAVAFWEKFGAGKQQPGIMEFLSTHPLDRNRVLRLQQAMPRALEEYARAPRKHGLGKTY
ncbi:MAG: M48 family metallopeptidase [Lentisphaeria bacterium]|nr:M48 family metallopeptidase [Lentisphaeria bacterium]